MSKDPEDTRREYVRMLEQGEENVRRVRALRDAHEGNAREDLDRRLRYCEHLLEQARESVRDVERDTLRLSVWKDLEQL